MDCLHYLLTADRWADRTHVAAMQRGDRGRAVGYEGRRLRKDLRPRAAWAGYARLRNLNRGERRLAGREPAAKSTEPFGALLVQAKDRGLSRSLARQVSAPLLTDFDGGEGVAGRG
jgi:hypothetical protein